METREADYLVQLKHISDRSADASLACSGENLPRCSRRPISLWTSKTKFIDGRGVSQNNLIKPLVRLNCREPAIFWVRTKESKIPSLSFPAPSAVYPSLHARAYPDRCLSGFRFPEQKAPRSISP